MFSRYGTVRYSYQEGPPCLVEFPLDDVSERVDGKEGVFFVRLLLLLLFDRVCSVGNQTVLWHL